MIDKFLYGFFAGLDNLCEKVSNYLYGVHLGHQKIIKNIVDESSKKNTKKE